MFTTVIIIAMVIAVLLMIVVLIQNPKGGGLSSEFGGSSSSQMFGVKKTGDLLEQLTWGFASAIVIISLVSRFMLDSGTSEGFKSINAEKAATKTLPSAPASAPAPTTAPAPTPAKAPGTK
jgi:preprotein translocase subunit SecG